mgnify:CR=1 FL=1
MNEAEREQLESLHASIDAARNDAWKRKGSTGGYWQGVFDDATAWEIEVRHFLKDTQEAERSPPPTLAPLPPLTDEMAKRLGEQFYAEFQRLFSPWNLSPPSTRPQAEMQGLAGMVMPRFLRLTCHAASDCRQFCKKCGAPMALHYAGDPHEEAWYWDCERGHAPVDAGPIEVYIRMTE